MQGEKGCPAPVLFHGLIDTGASTTCIDESIFRKLGIPPRGVVPIVTPSTGSTTHSCYEYEVDFAILMGDGEIHFSTLPVISTALGQPGFQALIGRDVLSQGILLYNGPKNEITLSF